MDVRILTAADHQMYDRYLRAHPQASLWQSLERQRYLEACGKSVRIYIARDADALLASALVSIDRTMGGFSTWEVARGPLWTRAEALKALVPHLREDASKDRCIELFISPLSAPESLHGFRASKRHVHAEATRMLGIDKDEDVILAQMHQKGRYNINVARKNGVTVRTGSADDVDAFYALLQSTGSRDGFTISQKSHYTRFLTSLPSSFILMAEADGKPIAGLIGVIWNGVGIYYYGASSYEHRQLMAPYALQWEAIRFCKAAGCTTYDLLGISPAHAKPNDPWWGITDFKRKFGGEVIAYPPEQSLVLRPSIKMLLGLKRKILG